MQVRDGCWLTARSVSPCPTLTLSHAHTRIHTLACTHSQAFTGAAWERHGTGKGVEGKGEAREGQGRGKGGAWDWKPSSSP